MVVVGYKLNRLASGETHNNLKDGVNLLKKVNSVYESVINGTMDLGLQIFSSPPWGFPFEFDEKVCAMIG